MSTLTVKELSAPTGEVIKIASGKTLDLNSQGTLILPTVPSAKMPAGSVIQVISGGSTNTANGGFLLTTTSTSFVGVAGMNLSITPSSTSSRIMITINTVLHRGSGARFTIYRGSTNIGGSSNGFARLTSTGKDYWHSLNLSYVDSPNTTSAVSYQLYASADAGTLYVGGDGDMKNVITVQEIQG